MKYLLIAINSKYIHSNLAVYSLKACLDKYKDKVTIKEYTINENVSDILSDIYLEKADVLFFSTYIWNVEYVKRISKEFRKINPKTKMFAGGPEVSYETENFLKENPEFSGVFVGEGEETFKECIASLEEQKSLKEVKGLFLRDGEDFHFAGFRENLDMNSLSFPYENLENFENKIIYYETSRGCPFNCSYCLSSVEKKLRFKDISIVKKELTFFIDKKVKQVKFVDRTFNCDKRHSSEIWKFIRDNDNGVTNFHFEVAADLISDEDLEIFKTMRPGLIQLEIGVQSVNEATIKEIHRTMKLERVEEVVKKIKSFSNIHEHLDLIAGLPYEDYESFKNSFNRIFRLRPEQLQLGFLKILKGSFMAEHVKDYEIQYSDYPPFEVLSTKWIDYDDILKLKAVEEMLEVYYNSHQYETSVEVLINAFQNPFDFFYELSKYYEKEGLFKISHSRIKRCEILLSFAGERGLDTDCLREALSLDIYLRENSKSRPGFSKDYSLWKEKAFKACKKGHENHLECFNYDLFKDFSKLKKPVYVLFDYEKRNPLTNQAETTIWEETYE